MAYLKYKLTNAAALHPLQICNLFILIILSGCGFTPTLPVDTHANLPAQELNKVQRVAFPRCAQFQETDLIKENVCEYKDSPQVFVGVAISGGGSRAANFSFAALNALDRMGIYQHVTAISSVSGGSLTSAFYTLNSPFLYVDELESAKKTIRQDFLAPWLARNVYPTNLVRKSFTDYDRSDLMASVFDDYIFHHKQFKDLPPVGRERPHLYINATLANHLPTRLNLTTRGQNSPAVGVQGFTFTTKAFDGLASSLDDLKISTAVMASGAFPGVFNAVTLKNYQYHSSDDIGSPYLHLIDGGAADNLGVDALLRALAEYRQNKHLLAPQDNNCLLILIDAHSDNGLSALGNMPDLRSNPVNYLVNGSLPLAFDALLDRRREDQLKALGINLSSRNPTRFVPDVRVDFGNERCIDYRGARTCNEMPSYGNFVPEGGQMTDSASCAVWHISLDRLLELTKSGGQFEREWTQVSKNSKFKNTDPEDERIEKLHKFVNSISTNYRLEVAGPGFCDAKDIQNSLFEAAETLIFDDVETLGNVLDWFDNVQRTWEKSRQEKPALDNNEIQTAELIRGRSAINKVRQARKQYDLPQFEEKESAWFHRSGNWLTCQ